MYDLPAALVTKLDPQVAAYIPTFVPQRLLTPEQWRRCDVAVWTACARTNPPSEDDAQTQMSVLCAFLAYTDRAVGSVDLAVVLHDDLVTRFLRETQHTVSKATLANRMARLRRSQRAVAGERARHEYRTDRAKTPPYTAHDLCRLAEAAAANGALAAALARALADGVVIPAACGTSAPELPALAEAVREFAIDGSWVASVPQQPLSSDEWREARRTAAAAGVTLTAQRLRITWLWARLSSPEPVAAIVGAYGLTRRDLDSVATYLPVATDAGLAGLLRG